MSVGIYTRRKTDINTHLFVKCAANECRLYTRRKTDRQTYIHMYLLSVLPMSVEFILDVRQT